MQSFSDEGVTLGGETILVTIHLLSSTAKSAINLILSQLLTDSILFLSPETGLFSQ